MSFTLRPKPTTPCPSPPRLVSRLFTLANKPTAKVEYWRQVHHISLPSSNFVFVKVRIGGMVRVSDHVSRHTLLQWSH